MEVPRRLRERLDADLRAMLFSVVPEKAEMVPEKAEQTTRIYGQNSSLPLEQI